MEPFAFSRATDPAQAIEAGAKASTAQQGAEVRFVAGGKVAIVTGVVITQPAATSNAGDSQDPAAVRHSRFTDVFVWRGARWQVVTGQETHFTASAR